MKLRTSFFNPTVLKKDITRFAPIWAIYSVICLLFLLGMAVTEPGANAQTVVDLVFMMASANMLYAYICAIFLFGDLFKPRLCNALHAMPLRREGWFLTHLTAGALFCLMPNLLSACASCLFLQSYSAVAFFWLAITLLEFLFFFGVASFSAMCAGTRLGMTAVYLLVNYLSLIILLFVQSLFMPQLYGLQLREEVFSFFCPVVKMTAILEALFDININHSVWRQFGGENWLYLGGCAVIGLIFAGLGLLVYRKRKLEYAGDFLALKALSPVFLVLYTLVVATPCYLLGSLGALWMGYLFLAVGVAVGFFTGRMFLERRVNVFKPKNLLGFGIFAVILTVSIGLTWLDPLGLTRYVPDTEDIKVVRLYDGFVTENPLSVERGVLLSDPEDLETITQVHEALIAEKPPENYAETFSVTLAYQMKDGRYVYRYYDVASIGRESRALRPYFSRAGYVFGTDDWESVARRTQGVLVRNYANDRHLNMGHKWFLEEWTPHKSTVYQLELKDGDEAVLTGLLEALNKDCAAGNLPQPYQYYSATEEGYIELHLGNQEELSIRYTKAATNTTAYLEQLFQLAGAPTE